MSPPRTTRRWRLRAAATAPLLLLVASCTASPQPSLPPFAFASTLPIPSFTGSCPASTVPAASGRTVVIPLHILTPSTVTPQIFAGVCLNGHGPYPFIVDTGSHNTIVDVAL